MNRFVALIIASDRCWRGFAETRLYGRDPGLTLAAVLALFVAAWMAFFAVAYVNIGLHPDVMEVYELSRHLAWGYPKHPPLMALIGFLWLQVFPLTHWSMALLALLNSGFALWYIALVARLYLPADRSIVIVLLLMLTPIFQFNAIRFNANMVLLALWPLATYCFLRSMETRRFAWALAAGGTAALAMLGKYYSVFLIAGFAAAAIATRPGRIYLASSAPWFSALAGLVVLAPHLVWLATHQMSPFTYAMEVHGGYSAFGAWREALVFVLGSAAYLVAPVVAWLIMMRAHLVGAPLRNVLRDMVRLPDRMTPLAIIFAVSVLAPALTAIVLHTDMPSIWAVPGIFMAIIILVGLARPDIARFDTVNLAGMIAVLTVLAIVLAPAYAWYRNDHPHEWGRNFYRGAAAEIIGAWRRSQKGPLRYVGGAEELALAASFYGEDHPDVARDLTFDWMVKRQPAQMPREGIAMACFSDDDNCLTRMMEIAAEVPQATASAHKLHSVWNGRTGAAAAIKIMIVPPRE